MHRSRLSTFVIDCETTDPAEAARFWGAALGREIRTPNPDYPNYRTLEMRDDEPVIYIQKVSHPSRVHLDIETDDIEAEVARLEKLGAKQLQNVKTWVIMEAPTGHRFCVVKPQRQPLDQLPSSNTWNE